MNTFVIDNDNTITAYLAGETIPEDHARFSSEKELAKLAANWPAERLVEIWNGFAGVPPFGDLKPVKKFTDRKTAVARIWRAIQALTPSAAPVASKTTKDATQPKGAREGSKKAIVLELLRRPGGRHIAGDHVRNRLDGAFGAWLHQRRSRQEDGAHGRISQDR